MKKNIFYLICGFSLSVCAFGQSLTMAQADQMLIEKNLYLQAEKYKVDIADAQIIQAKLFDNPSINFQVPLYSPEFNWFDFKGQWGLELEQSIQIAGKRKAGIQLANSQKSLANWEYELLSKQLKFAAHTSFFNGYFIQQTLQKVETEIQKMDLVLDAYNTQYKKGNVTLRDVVRLRATYNDLIANRLELQQQKIDEISSLKTLLLIDPEAQIEIAPTENELQQYQQNNFALVNWKEVLANQNPQIKTALADLELQQKQLAFEKKQAVPDLITGIAYDKFGNYTKDFFEFNIGISIPIFNRNQGQIKMAELGIKQKQTEIDFQTNELLQTIQNRLSRIENLEKQLQAIGPDFESQFETLMQHVSENYLKGNLSLLEFTDLIETYNEQLIFLNQIKQNKVLAYEELNYYSGY